MQFGMIIGNHQSIHIIYPPRLKISTFHWKKWTVRVTNNQSLAVSFCFGLRGGHLKQQRKKCAKIVSKMHFNYSPPPRQAHASTSSLDNFFAFCTTQGDSMKGLFYVMSLALFLFSSGMAMVRTRPYMYVVVWRALVRTRSVKCATSFYRKCYLQQKCT